MLKNILVLDVETYVQSTLLSVFFKIRILGEYKSVSAELVGWELGQVIHASACGAELSRMWHL